MNSNINLLNIFDESPSKQTFQKLLKETIDIAANRLEKEYDEIYHIIYAQLQDIKLNIIDYGILDDPDDVNERYSLGQIAVMNFNEGDEMRKRLSCIFWGALNYFELQD